MKFLEILLIIFDLIAAAVSFAITIAIGIYLLESGIIETRHPWLDKVYYLGVGTIAYYFMMFFVYKAKNR